ncbi:MAG: MFS transporter [archaeon]|nr:MAG: MFS transporter [archaeon]
MTQASQADPATVRAPSLFHHYDFMKLWIGESISVFGSQFSPIAILFVATNTLNFQPIQFGILAALGTLAFLVFGLPVGVWADRKRRKRTMIGADVGRAVILLAIPLAAIFGGLSAELLYAVALTTGILTVFFEICYQSYLPTLVERRQLVEANSKLQASAASAQTTGPTLATVVISLISAPAAIVGDVIGYFSSAAFLTSIRRPEVVVPMREGRSALMDIKEGLAVVFGDARLRSIAGSTATANLFSSAWGAILFPYLIRELGLPLVELGVIFSIGAAGGILGAIVASRIAKNIGVGTTVILSAFVFSLLQTPLYFVSSSNAFFLLVPAFFGASLGSVVYNVGQVSFRQALVSVELQGRMNATMRTLVWGTLPIGGLLGGLLGQLYGYHTAIGIAVAGGMLAFLWVLFSPVRGIKDIPNAPLISSNPEGTLKSV